MAKYFICKICYIVAEQPTATRCGHLFCRRCLSAWLYSHSINFECPVCKERIQANELRVVNHGRVFIDQGYHFMDGPTYWNYWNELIDSNDCIPFFVILAILAIVVFSLFATIANRYGY
ncbi:hypothetical protein KSP39_PZI021470 [Platanthera zijinensis]|uniref:E3 ubiquitin-protein ligase RMA n=1 Tax=Platanthera zijinensis TaxID=2320716 RepID=A0AAP0AYF5_9ASPA